MGCLQQVLRQAGGAGAGGAVRAALAGRHQPNPAHQILHRPAARDAPALQPPALSRTVEDGRLVGGELVKGEEAPPPPERTVGSGGGV